MVSHDDLGALYAKDMEHFGCGIAMFQPVSATDMRPPCIGYLDNNRRWNSITNIDCPSNNGLQVRHNSLQSSFQPLERAPRKLEHLGIEWTPRTSIGVREWLVDANGQLLTTGLPVGADAHIKYKSNSNFGAVLIAQKPITLTSYNDETLFQSWLAVNKPHLSALHGAELRRYGLHIVTRTFTSPGCSINAWKAKDKEANVSIKAKASMLGELGEDLNWSERLTDKDWSHYCGRDQGDTVVLFFDGIEVPASVWWREGLRGVFTGGKASRNHSEGAPGGAKSKGKGESPLRNPRVVHNEDSSRQDEGPSSEDLWGSSTALRRGSLPRNRSISRGPQLSTKHDKNLSRSMSTPRRLSRHLQHKQAPTSLDHETAQASPPSPKTRVLTLEPPHQRLSMASTATTTSSMGKVRELTGADFKKRPALSQLKPLQRKTVSPSLRHTS